MKLINRENGEELVEVGSHKDYASKGVAGAGLGLGIAGTALYISIDTQLKILVQEALVNSVKNVIENSEIGNKLLTQQLNLIKTNKDKIIAESNRELETFKKFQIAAQANPNLTYKEFCENINNK